MNTIIRTEFYKIVSKKYLWAFVILFSVFLALITFQHRDSFTVLYPLQPIRNEIQLAVDNEKLEDMIRGAGYAVSYEDIRPFLTPATHEYIERYKTVHHLEAPVGSMLEWRIGFAITNYFQRKDDRHNKIQSIQDNLTEMHKNARVDSFLYTVKTRLSDMYEQAGESEIELNLDRSWNQIIDLNYAWIVPGITMLIILLGLAGIYSDEHVNNTVPALLTAKKGRQSLFFCKLVAGTLYSFLCVLYFQLFTVLVTGIVYGFPDSNISLMSVFGFKLTPFAWSALEFYLIQVLGSLLAAFSMSSLIMCFSAYCKNALLPFFLAGNYYGATFLWAKMIELPPYTPTLLSLPAELSPFMLQSITGLVSTGRFINLFGSAALTLYANILFNLFIAVFSLLFCYRGYIKKQVKG